LGTKHRDGYGLYLVKGSVNVQLAEKTGFSQEDAELLKQALATLFENDTSSARPEGSMEVNQMYWWQHEDKTPAISTARVHRSIKVIPQTERPQKFEDYKVEIELIEGLKPEVL